MANYGRGAYGAKSYGVTNYDAQLGATETPDAAEFLFSLVSYASLIQTLENLSAQSTSTFVVTKLKDSGPNVGKNKRRLLKLAQLREKVQREERDIETLLQLGAL